MYTRKWIVCVIAVIGCVLGCDAQQERLSGPDLLAKAQFDEEVAKREMGMMEFPPDFTTETTVGFRTQRNSIDDVKLPETAVILLKSTLIRAETWLKKHPERHGKILQIIEGNNETGDSHSGSIWYIVILQVILQVEPLTPEVTSSP